MKRMGFYGFESELHESGLCVQFRVQFQPRNTPYLVVISKG